MAERVSQRGKRKTGQFRGMFVWIIVFYFYNIFLTINAFYNKNGYKRFSKTNSTSSFNKCVGPFYHDLKKTTKNDT